MWKNVTRYGGLITLGMTADIITRRKVYSYPGFIQHMRDAILSDNPHRQKYSTFYDDHPVYGNKTRPATEEDAKRGNILMLRHGRDSGVPVFNDRNGNPVNNADYNFLTLANKIDEGCVNPHICDTNKTHVQLLRSIGDRCIDYVFLLSTGYRPGSDPYIDSKDLLQELDRIMKDTGEIVINDELFLFRDAHLLLGGRRYPKFIKFAKSNELSIVRLENHGCEVRTVRYTK
jgi:hypothetical protein